MKIVGNEQDIFFLLYIQQVVLSRYEEDIVSFLLEKGMEHKKVEGLIFLLKLFSFEENEKEYSMLTLQRKEDKRCGGNPLSYSEIGFRYTPYKINNWFVDK